MVYAALLRVVIIAAGTSISADCAVPPCCASQYGNVAVAAAVRMRFHIENGTALAAPTS
jgi:hypothetical protein